MFHSDRSKLVRDMLEALETGHDKFIQPTPLRPLLDKYLAKTRDKGEGKIQNMKYNMFQYYKIDM